MDDDAYCAELRFSKLVDGKWTAPAVASFSQKLKDDSPSFSPDGNRLFFNRNDGTKENVCYVERTAGGWSDPVVLPVAVNSLMVHWQLSIAADGSLYFGGRDVPTGTSPSPQTDIYLAQLRDGQYTSAQLVGDPISSPLLEHSPHIARDGSYMLFSRGTRENVDLYASFRQADGSWGQAIRFNAPINAPSGHDHCPRVTDDGKYMFWVSTRNGVSQPYWVDAAVIEELRPR